MNNTERDEAIRDIAVDWAKKYGRKGSPVYATAHDSLLVGWQIGITHIREIEQSPAGEQILKLNRQIVSLETRLGVAVDALESFAGYVWVGRILQKLKGGANDEG